MFRIDEADEGGEDGYLEACQPRTEETGRKSKGRNKRSVAVREKRKREREETYIN